MIFGPYDPRCDADRLERLLRDELPETEKARAIAHLDKCGHCQERLERLAAGTRWWREARCLGTEGEDDPEDCGAAEEVSLDFLDPPDEAGQIGKLGPYAVLEVIGRGGMGVVLKAHDITLNRFVAIKILAPHLTGAAVGRRRFYREAKAAAAVSHEHVVAIHAVESGRRLPWLVMQYVAGKSLQQRIDQTGPLDPVDIVRIGREAAAGLAAAHARGLIHRDVKPSNILLENGVERVKLTDFGLALAVDDASVTQSGLVAGTPQYMAPEQARGDAVDHRADLFSLGSVLYAMACGRPPYRAGSTVAVLRRVSDESPRPIREVNPDVPEWLADIIARLHARDPDDRFQSAAEVADLLGRWLAHLHNPKGVPAPEQPRKQKRLRNRRMVAAGVLALGGLIVAAGASDPVHQAVQHIATLIRIQLAGGTLLVEVDDPDVKVRVDGEELVLNGAGPQEIRVRPGTHAVTTVKNGVPIRDEVITVERGGRRVVRVAREWTDARPAAAGLSPFEATARQDRIEGTTGQPSTKGARSSARSRTGEFADVPPGVNKLVAHLKHAPAPLAPSEAERFGLFMIDVLEHTVTRVAAEPDPGYFWCGSPCWANDGERLAFDASPGAKFGRTRIKMISSRGLTDLGEGNCPSFSPDGQHIAFQLLSGNDRPAGIYIMGIDGSAPRRVADPGRPKWSPDGRRLLIVGFSLPCELLLANLDGSSRPIAGLDTYYSNPEWAGEDTIIAAMPDKDEALIALFNVRNPARPQRTEVLWRQTARLDVSPSYPVYSAAARRCVFVGAGPRGMALYCLDRDTPDVPRRLEPDHFDNVLKGLAISPDGRYVLFCSDRPRPPVPRAGDTAPVSRPR